MATWRAVVGLAAVVFAAEGRAWGDAPSEADALFAQGRELLERAQYAEACPKLARSEHLAPAVGTLLNLGYCYEQIGRFRSAMDAYGEAEVLAKGGGDPKRAAFAKERLGAVEARVMKVVVRVVPPEAPGLEVRRNGTPVPKTDYGQAIPVDPDEIEVAATAPDRVGWKGIVTARGDGAVVTVFVPPLAEKSAVTTAAEAAKAAPAKETGTLGARRVAALALGAGAALALGAGAALGLGAKSRYDDSKSGCDATGCEASSLDVQRSAVTQGNVATALLGLGVLAAGAGVYLWFFGGDAGAPARTPARASARALPPAPILGARF